MSLTLKADFWYNVFHGFQVNYNPNGRDFDWLSFGIEMFEGGAVVIIQGRGIPGHYGTLSDRETFI